MSRLLPGTRRLPIRPMATLGLAVAVAVSGAALAAPASAAAADTTKPQLVGSVGTARRASTPSRAAGRAPTASRPRTTRPA